MAITEQFIAAGWQRITAQQYKHATDGELYRDGQNGRWYLRRGDKTPKEMSRQSLADAMAKTLAATRQGVLA